MLGKKLDILLSFPVTEDVCENGEKWAVGCHEGLPRIVDVDKGFCNTSVNIVAGVNLSRIIIK